MTLRWQCMCVDTPDPAPLGRWWAELLGWRITHEGDDEVVLEPPAGSAEDGVSPDILFLRVAEGNAPRARVDGEKRNRLHLDLRPDDHAAEVERAIALGARRIDIGQGDAVTWAVMEDPEGNEFCILRALTPEELSS